MTSAVLAVLAGCSVKTYEERLDKTNELFKYMNLLNDNLAESAWGDTYGFGIRMRPPQPFTLIPPPPLPTEENPSPVDQRHPTFLPQTPELPGLIGAWMAPMPTTDGRSPTPAAFLYVMGNHQRFLDKMEGEGGGPEPSDFLVDLESTLQMAVLGNNNPLPESNSGSQDNARYQERIPRTPRIEGFPIPKEFTAISFLWVDQPPGGQSIRLQLFEYTPPDSNVQLAVLMIYPANFQEDPVYRLRLALETLEMNNQPPQPQRTGDGGGAADVPF